MSGTPLLFSRSSKMMLPVESWQESRWRIWPENTTLWGIASHLLGEFVDVWSGEPEGVFLLLVVKDHVQGPLQHGLGVEHDEGGHPSLLLLAVISLGMMVIVVILVIVVVVVILLMLMTII